MTEFYMVCSQFESKNIGGCFNSWTEYKRNQSWEESTLRGCVSCLNIICLRKKQNRKQQKPVKAEDVVEPVVGVKDKEESSDKKTNVMETTGYSRAQYMSTNGGLVIVDSSVVCDDGELADVDSSSSLKNYFKFSTK